MEIKYDHLLGRPYEDARVHCYKLVRDLYKDNFGIELGDYAIPADWDSNTLNLIEMIYRHEGMEKVMDWTPASLRPGDLLCIAVRRNNPNHFVIYVGENKVVHHPLAQRSREEPMGDFYRMNTCFVLRHPDVPDLRPKLPDTTIQDLLNARNRLQAAEEA